MSATDPKVVWHSTTIEREQRESLNGHCGAVVWFTGLSGSGKSTIANAVDAILYSRRIHSVLLDGDNVRHGLCAGPNLLAEKHGKEFADRFGLGFGAADREENIRRVGSLAQLFSANGLVVLTAFVSPYRRDRDRVREWVESHGRPGEFIEVFVDSPLEVCEARDPKGLYKQARAGKIPNFTGISDPYEPPIHPEIHLQSANRTPQELAEEVVDWLQLRGILSKVAS